MLPVLAKLHLLLGVLSEDPILVHSGLAYRSHGSILPGFSTIDPNIAFTSQTLGRAAARDILNGDVPWWNFYQGVGGPLAGDMQSAALFPFTLLLYFPHGQLYMHILLQIIAGSATFFLLRKIGLSPIAAAIGGVLFEFNGTFSWLANAVINPIAFLPVMLLGIETVHDRTIGNLTGGWLWISLGLALSLYAGFPEVAYLNGLLAACWALIRLRRLSIVEIVGFLRNLAIGLLAGLLLAAPILIAFFDFLQNAYVGRHDGDAFKGNHLPAASIMSVALPYIFGFIFQGDASFTPSFWNIVGGYAGVGMLALSGCGACGAHYRALRLLLVGWIVVTIGGSYGVPWFMKLLTLIPAVKLSMFFRYLSPSWEFSLAILTAFAVDDAIRGGSLKAGRAFWLGIACMAGFISLATYLMITQPAVAHMPKWLTNSIVQSSAVGLVVLFALAITGLRRMQPATRAKLIGGICAGEAILYFILPTLANPRDVGLALGGVEYLQANLGTGRFFSLGPIQPNYGAYFGIAGINHNDLPLPRDWVDYVTTTLDPGTDPVVFNAINRSRPDSSTAAENLRRMLSEFQETGVKYVVTTAGFNPFGWTGEAPPAERGDGSFTDLSGIATVTLPARPYPGVISGVSLYVLSSKRGAKGRLAVHVCAGDVCGDGSRDLADILNYSAFIIPLARPILIPASPLEVTIRQLDGDKPVALGAWEAKPDTKQSFSIDGTIVAGRDLRAVIEQGGVDEPRRVFTDKMMTIYELPHPRPYFTAQDCSLEPLSRRGVTADCPGPAKLLRLEYFEPGARAFVDGREVPVNRAERIFQQIDIPAGRTTISFDFRPPFMRGGYAAFFIGLLLSAAGAGWPAARRSKGEPRA